MALIEEKRYFLIVAVYRFFVTASCITTVLQNKGRFKPAIVARRKGSRRRLRSVSGDHHETTGGPTPGDDESFEGGIVAGGGYLVRKKDRLAEDSLVEECNRKEDG